MRVVTDSLQYNDMEGRSVSVEHHVSIDKI